MAVQQEEAPPFDRVRAMNSYGLAVVPLRTERRIEEWCDRVDQLEGFAEEARRLGLGEPDGWEQ